MSDRLSVAEPANLVDQLNRFFDLFEPSIQLAERLTAARSNAQEVILLK